MCAILIILFLYISIESIANIFVFRYLKNKYNSKRNDNEKIMPWLKGVVERLCLNIGLLLGYPQVLIAFGTLKIGTKLNNKTINSEYYLLGNIASILTSFVFIFCYKSESLWNWFEAFCS